MDRKKFTSILTFGILSTIVYPSTVFKNIKSASGNFIYVYRNKKLKEQFFYFLKNVFHLYPENEFHHLINEVSFKEDSDKSIYLKTQFRLKDITSYFSIFKYKLPALFKQKEIMAKQTVELLGKGTIYEGYLEIGSSGRYLDYLEESCIVTGDRYYADGKKPGYGVSEMVDRGQISIGATYIPLTDYKTKYKNVIPENSLALVTVYIGFHHCPINLRTSFILSIKDVLKKGGKLILRDHDCHNEDQTRIVALAHDVFNMGTNETWEYNEKELRNFYTLDFIIRFVENLGFKYEGRSLFQKGDPTKNALMLFTKKN